MEKPRKQEIIEEMSEKAREAIRLATYHGDFYGQILSAAYRRRSDEPNSPSDIIGSDVLSVLDDFLASSDDYYNEVKTRVYPDYRELSAAYVRDRDLVQSLVEDYFHDPSLRDGVVDIGSFIQEVRTFW